MTLVTGATGDIGTTLTEQLTQTDLASMVMRRRPEQIKALRDRCSS